MSTCTYFSQYGEDKILADIFPNHMGVCVEVGANDGKTYSNSLFFEQRGWQCILIEPTPHLCSIIRETRKGRLFECACSSSEGEVIFNFFEDHNLYSSIEHDATMSQALNQSIAIKTKIKTRTLDSILEESKIENIDFITIDVEGHETSVLQGFTIERYNPKIIIIEDNSDTEKTQILKLMKAKGYSRFYRSGGNDWYARKPTTFIRLSNKWKFKGIFKANVPIFITKPLILINRRFKRLFTLKSNSI